VNDDRRYRIAVWIVIASEALLFSGLFALYACYRIEYTGAFEAGVRTDIQWIGGLNTFLLLTSSFAIAWAIYLVRTDRLRGAIWSLAAVLALGAAFLGFKLYEWSLHIREGVVPGLAYAGPDHGTGTSLFFTLYYGMTGLHALHVVAGLVLVTWVFRRAYRRRLDRDHHLSLELVALYWHFVDAVWVFLWPMFYLMHG
jgi:cytochrome c oxidase subunit III